MDSHPHQMKPEQNNHEKPMKPKPKNPVFFGLTRFPDKSPSMTNLEFAITQNFLDILMLPARKKLAAMQFE